TDRSARAHRTMHPGAGRGALAPVTDIGAGLLPRLSVRAGLTAITKFARLYPYGGTALGELVSLVTDSRQGVICRLPGGDSHVLVPGEVPCHSPSTSSACSNRSRALSMLRIRSSRRPSAVDASVRRRVAADSRPRPCSYSA